MAIEHMKWSGKGHIPAIGTEVNVRLNGLGRAVVKGHFVEHGWVGLLVDFLDPPAWWLKQNASEIADANGQLLGHVFGAEIECSACE